MVCRIDRIAANSAAAAGNLILASRTSAFSDVILLSGENVTPANPE